MKTIILLLTSLSLTAFAGGSQVGTFSVIADGGSRVGTLKSLTESFKDITANNLQQSMNLKNSNINPALAYQILKDGNSVKFQTATAVQGKWVIQTWQGSTTELLKNPDLMNALNDSSLKLDWQKFK